MPTVPDLNAIIRSFLDYVRTDQLTGLNNRHALQEDSQFRPERRPGAVILADVCNFKRINQVSHSYGDMIIGEIGSALSVCAKARAATVYRYGGDEFVIITPSRETTDPLIEDLRRSFSPLRRDNPEHNVPRLEVFLTLGVAYVQPEELTIDVALKRAEQALSVAKATGRARFAVHTHGPETAIAAPRDLRQTCTCCGSTIILMVQSNQAVPTAPACPICTSPLTELGT